MRVLSQEFDEAVPLADLTPHPINPNHGDVGAIYTSIDANGWYGAIIIQKNTGIICAGEHRVAAAREAGADAVPAIIVDCDDATALRILLADNRTAALATNDLPALADALAVIARDDSLLGTGYDADDLDAITREANSMLPPLPPTEEHLVTCPECGARFATDARPAR
jgi:ParB-like chromosome segregation protein Spo0J